MVKILTQSLYSCKRGMSVLVEVVLGSMGKSDLTEKGLVSHSFQEQEIFV